MTRPGALRPWVASLIPTRFLARTDTAGDVPSAA